MELRQLEYFVAVADERNFTRAAARVHVVQSAVSAAVSRLEREVGMDLFDRSGRAVELTEAGRVLLRRARSLLGEARGIREDMSRLAGGLQGTVSVGTVLSTGSFGLTSALAAFQRAYPGVAVHLRFVPGTSADHMAMLRDGRIDLALLPMVEPFSAGIACERLASMRMVLAARADDPLASRRDVDYHDLAGQRFVDFPEHWGNRIIVERLFAQAGVSRTVALEVVDVASALELVSGRLGVAFVPEEALDGRSDLVRVALRHPPAAVDLGLCVADDRPLPEATRALRDALRARGSDPRSPPDDRPRRPR